MLGNQLNVRHQRGVAIGIEPHIGAFGATPAAFGVVNRVPQPTNDRGIINGNHVQGGGGCIALGTGLVNGGKGKGRSTALTVVEVCVRGKCHASGFSHADNVTRSDDIATAIPQGAIGRQGLHPVVGDDGIGDTIATTIHGG